LIDYLYVDELSRTDFIITCSCDGHIKFWKKQETGIEFVKHFRGHLGNIQDISINVSGTLLCTLSNDKSLKVFDVVNFGILKQNFKSRSVTLTSLLLLQI